MLMSITFVSDEPLRSFANSISYIFDVIRKDTGRFCPELLFLEAGFRERRFQRAAPAPDLAPISLSSQTTTVKGFASPAAKPKPIAFRARLL